MKSPWSHSIRTKLIASSAVYLALVCLVAVVAMQMYVRIASKAAAAEAIDVARAIAHAAGLDPLGNAEALQQRLDGLGKIYERDIFVVDLQQRVVASSFPHAGGATYASAAVAETLRDGHPRHFEGPDASAPGTALQATAPLRKVAADPTSPIVGAVVFEYTLFYDALRKQAHRAAFITATIATLCIIAAWLYSLRVSAAVVAPLRALQRGASQVGAGRYETRVDVQGRDEIGRLAETFNDMAAALAASRAGFVAQAEEMSQLNARLLEEARKQKLAAERIEYLAYNDELTALPNRSMFSRLLAHEILQAQRYRRQFAVFFIDLDRFKQINDTLGHGTGDALLKQVASRLMGCLRASDTVARLGGDEFVVLLPELEVGRPVDSVENVARKMLAAISKPLLIAGQELRITASIGISTFPEHGADEKSLMKNADVAMYQAKEGGKNNFHFYSEQLDINSFERLAMESSLRRAIERNELEVYYQPKKNLQTGAVSGMEALIRWNHPDLGMVSPVQFIPVAEETGLIVPIGRWVLRNACQQVVQWTQEGLPDLKLAVNLSPRQFQDEDLLQDVTEILEETGMDPHYLELEITESTIMRDAARARSSLDALRARGISIAIDDFGTGYSSLSTLKQFPIDTLKIDRSFVRDIATDPEDRGITEAIIAMGKTLKLHLVAEGVETLEQAAFLRERACDDFQGYLFSQPVPAAQFAALLAGSLSAASA